MIPLARPDIGQREEELVLEVLRSGMLSLGPVGRRFEEDFAAYVGTRHAAAVSSGTAGLHLAVRLAGVGAGDEVITSPFSFVASANCALYEGATPVFADIDPVTFNIDPAAVEAADHAADARDRAGARVRPALRHRGDQRDRAPARPGGDRGRAPRRSAPAAAAA